MKRCALTLVLSLLLVTITFGAAPPTQPILAPALPKNLLELRQLEKKIQEALLTILPATVGVGNGGSGVVVSADGMIVSVAHVTQKAGREVVITFPDGKRAKAKTLGNHKNADASLLQLQGDGPWPHVGMGKSTEVKSGAWCLAVGYPVSFARGQKPPVRLGRVLRQASTTITSDCPIMGGDSGGPLFDLEGRVIGVHSRAGGNALGNIHVSIDVYHDNWKRLKAGEDWGDRNPAGGSSFETAMPGFELFPLLFAQGPRNKQSSAYERNNEVIRGAFTEAVEPLSRSTVRILVNDKPAMLGTIVSADGLIITKVEGTSGTLTCKLPGGKVVAAKKLGEDKDHDLALLEVDAKDLTPITWAKDIPSQGRLVACPGEDGKALALGLITNDPRQFRLSTPPQAKRAYLGVRSDSAKTGGLLINNVWPNTPAEKAGLKNGDVVIKIGTIDINTTEQLRQSMEKFKPDEKVEVLLKRGDEEKKLQITLGKVPEDPPAYDKWGGGPFSERRFGYPAVLPHDTVLRPGDCGGVLVDTQGRAVGLNISRSLRISTYTLIPEDVAKVVKKLSENRKKDDTKPKS